MVINKSIDKYLLKLKKGKNTELPYGSYTKIAKKFGVSRVYVRLRASRLDIKVGSRRTRKDIRCKECQKLFYPKRDNNIFCTPRCYRRYKFYRGHRLVLCDICGKGIIQKITQIKRSKTKKFYCSRECFNQCDHLKNLGKTLRRLYGSDYYDKISLKGIEALRKKVKTD